MLFLTRSRERKADVSVEPEQLRTLLSFAISDRLEVARRIFEGIPLRSPSGPTEAKNIDLSPLFEVGLLDQQEWERSSDAGVVTAAGAEMLLRYIRVYSSAVETFGHAQARNWLLMKNGSLGQQLPIMLLASEDGGRAVETLLGRIGYGIAS